MQSMRPSFRRKPLIACILGCFGAAAFAQDKPTATLPPVEVIGTTPIPGLGVQKDRIPSNVQSIDAKAIKDSQATNLPDFMGSQLPSVNVNEFQGNPYQPDVNFRGFSASPLLGTPQGLSVYQDGVRVNQPFGDVVSWDLIPQAAIGNVALIPGSNPLFGLNTLGGALSLTTKSGDTHPGTELEVQAGSFDRRQAEFATGHKLGNGVHAFAAGTWFEEDGWRDFSPSEVRQFFGKLGKRSENFELEVGLTVADNDLIGNGLVPRSFFERRREGIFTLPDQTRNEMNMVNASGTWFLSDDSQISATLYNRRTKTNTLNGDGNDEYENDFEDDPTADLAPAVSNRTSSVQKAWGGALQWSLATGAHQLAAGATHDRSKTTFEMNSTEGDFDDARGVVETGAPEPENNLLGISHTTSVFIADTWSLRPDLHLALSGRYNRTTVRLRDFMPARTLNGDHEFSKFNPALGLTWQASPLLTVYGNLSQANRAPTPIELGCADPENPCTLPNALAADPPLEQVVARTLELGARGRLSESLRWNAGVYQTNNKDDILFVGTTTSAGFFTNFGKTRRRGAELGLSGDQGPFTWHASYSYVKATFESPACIVAENNSSRGTDPACTQPDPDGAGDDLIAVRPGDRIPGIPEHALKLGVTFRATARWRVGAEVVAFSDQFLRGNENNQHRAGTATDVNGEERTFLDAGKASGYAVVNLNTRYDLGGGWEVFGKVSNLFDRKYFTGGALAENPFDASNQFQADPDDWTREAFLAPGAPRAGWVGVRYRFGG